MTIAKRHVAVEELLGVFLNFTPRAADTDLFRADMRILNQTLLRDSIKECHAVSKGTQLPGMAQRTEIHRVYSRKTKELAALYPFVFSVENALRHTAAEFYSEAFNDDAWWAVIRNAISAGHDEKHFKVDPQGKKNIKGVAVTPKFIKQLFYGFNNMSASQRRIMQRTDVIDEMYLCLSLRSLCNIIEADWNLSRNMFVSNNALGGELRKQDMSNWFNILITARNELFHCNPLGDISKISRACESILDKLGFHLGEFDNQLREIQVTRTPTNTLRSAYHLVPPCE